MMKHALAALVLLNGLLVASDPDTVHVDVIELLRGSEIEGQASISTIHQGYLYTFSSQANLGAFREAPERYEIQLEGACARMGELSGRGKPQFHAVHGGKLYIFASMGCRDTFLDAPERLLMSDDTRPVPGDEAVAEGKRILGRVLAGLGGPQLVDAVKNYRYAATSTSVHRGENIEQSRSKRVLFPSQVRLEYSWGEHEWGYLLAGSASRSFSSNGSEPLGPVRQQALRHIVARDLIYILKSRHREDFIVAAAGTGQIGSQDVDHVLVHFDGASTTLGVDPESGRVLSIAYRGRGPDAFIGEVVKYYSDFQLIEGLVLARTESGTFDGGIVPAWTRFYSTVTINEEISGDQFEQGTR